MIRLMIATALTASLFCASTISQASPLDTGSWTFVARMADGDAGMFDGNGGLQSGYSYGTYTGNLLQANDFQIPFNVYPGMDILFITGDQTIWGKTSYSTLRSLIDAQAGVFTPNIAFDARVNGIEQPTMGNVLSRPGVPEDPWISLLGDHVSGILTSLIIWGENDYSDIHAALKNAHQGVNVFVSYELTATPVPGALLLFASVLGLAGFVRWIRRKMSGPTPITA